MNRRELEELLRRSDGKKRVSSVVTVGDEVVTHKETVDVFDPVEQVWRTVVLEQRLECSRRHVLSEANPVVATCQACNDSLCKIPGCMEACAVGSCAIPLCSMHRFSISGQIYCSRHFLSRAFRLILGF